MGEKDTLAAAFSNGWRITRTKTYEHDCDSCRFMYSMQIIKEHKITHTVDVWESCEKQAGSVCDAPYIIRYSSDPPDYACVSLPTIIAAYVERRNHVNYHMFQKRTRQGLYSSSPQGQAETNEV
jgi:hypothetical protein